MSNVALNIDGSIPSKKNSRINCRNGRSFPSKSYSDWEKYAIQQVRLQTKQRFFGPVAIDIIIYFGTKTRSDLDNRLTSIMDMLVNALVIRDDKWQDVPSISVKAEYRAGNPGANININELQLTK